MAESKHTKGNVAPGKTPVNWRILETVVENLKAEAIRQGFGEKGIAAFVNNHFTRYFKGEVMMYEPEKRGQ